MIEIMLAFASLFLLCAAMIARPNSARCPRTFYDEGIRPSGEYTCRRTPIGGDHRNSRGVLIDDSFEPRGALHSRIYCTGGTRPIANDDGVSVGCQR